MARFVITAPQGSSGVFRFTPNIVDIETESPTSLTPSEAAFAGHILGDLVAFGGTSLVGTEDPDTGFYDYTGTVTRFSFARSMGTAAGLQIEATGLSLDAANVLVPEYLTIFSQLVAGHDEIIGSQMHEFITAGSGADTLRGGAGDDTLSGDQWTRDDDTAVYADLLYGGDGNDRLIADQGRDVLYGGRGVDMFVFSPHSRLADAEDFNHRADMIGLMYLEGIGRASRPLAAKFFHVGKGAHDASDRIIYQRATGQIWYDEDGTGGARKILIGRVDAGAYLDVSDFWVMPEPGFPI